jgi:phage terminase large subunit-like protein
VTAHQRATAEAELQALEEEVGRRANYKHRKYFQDEGPLRRALYVQHCAFLRAGAMHRERLFLAANQIGKTDAAAYEVRCHLTGQYPPWWEGRRFDGPTRWWGAGDTMETTRNIIQVALLGPHDGVPRAEWLGMLDAHLIVHHTRKSGGISNCIDTIWVRHVSGERSSFAFKSYDQGRKTFQGAQLEGVWLDEEPPDPADTEMESEAEGSTDIYTECLLRTITTDGIVIATFTPLRGLTKFVSDYLETAEMCDASGRIVAAKGILAAAGGAPIDFGDEGDDE